MPVILRRLPVPERDALTFVGAEQVRLRADQIIVWVSLALRDVLTGDRNMRRFPALLDTGMNHFFCLQERQLMEWAGLTAGQLEPLGRVRERGQALALYAASLFLFRNVADSADVDAAAPPDRVALPRGITVYPTAGGFPRLPLLGLRAIVHNRLRLTIAGDRRQVNLSTPRRWWPFG